MQQYNNVRYIQPSFRIIQWIVKEELRITDPYTLYMYIKEMDHLSDQEAEEGDIYILFYPDG